jgi:hypothetical protein
MERASRSIAAKWEMPDDVTVVREAVADYTAVFLRPR